MGAVLRGFRKFFRKLLLGRDAHLSEAFKPAHDVARAGGEGLVGVLGVGLQGDDAAAYLVELLHKGGELVIEVGGLAGYLLRVLVLPFGLPQVENHLQGKHEVGGVDEDDALLVGILSDLGVGAQGKDVASLVGDEHENLAQCAGHKFVILLLRQFVYVGADAAQIVLLCLFHLFAVLCAGIVEIGGEAHLAVNDDAAFAGAVHNDIGAVVGAFFVLYVLLHFELYARSESAVFQNAGKELLAPIALHLAVALQRLCQVGGVALHLLGVPEQPFDGLVHACLLCRGLFSGLIDALLHFLQVLAYGGDQMGYAFLYIQA